MSQVERAERELQKVLSCNPTNESEIHKKNKRKIEYIRNGYKINFSAKGTWRNIQLL